MFSYSFIYGKGNVAEEPDFKLNSFFGSVQVKNFILTGQFYTGKGDSFGKMIDETFNAYSNHGYSMFGELFFVKRKLSIFGRYDYFVSEQEIDIQQETYIAGIAYHFMKKSKLLFDFDYAKKENISQKFYEIAVEINF